VDRALPILRFLADILNGVHVTHPHMPIVNTSLQQGVNMIRFHALALTLTAVMPLISISADARTAQAVAQTTSTISNSATIGLSIVLPKEQIPVGQKTWVFLTVKNLSSDVISYPQDRVYVEGEEGEPPTTLRQRQLTHKRRAGEPSILGGGFEPNIEPKESFTRKYDLSELYDLSKPGKYTVSIEVLDEFNSNRGKGGWVRSPAASFVIQAPSQSQ